MEESNPWAVDVNDGWDPDEVPPPHSDDDVPWDTIDPHEWPEIDRAKARAELDEERSALDPDEPLTPEAKMRASILHGDDICDIPPPDPLMGGLLNRDSLAVLYGPPGGGKSFVALDWAMHIIRGSWWHDLEVEQGNVLYILAEGVRGTGKRVTAWKTHHRTISPTPDGFTWLPMPIDLREPSWVGPLKFIAAEINPSFIVVDTLNRCAPGTDEGPADMGKIIAAADGLRRTTGACVLIVHHSGKDIGAGARGHSSLLGAVDTELELKSTESRIVLKVTKQKDGADGQTFRLRMVPAADSIAIDLDDGRAIPGEDTLTVNARLCLETLEAMAMVDGIATTIWRDASMDTGVSKSSFYECLKALNDAGMVRNIGNENRQRWVPIDVINEEF